MFHLSSPTDWLLPRSRHKKLVSQLDLALLVPVNGPFRQINRVRSSDYVKWPCGQEAIRVIYPGK